jgi:hypothetical protein
LVEPGVHASGSVHQVRIGWGQHDYPEGDQGYDRHKKPGVDRTVVHVKGCRRKRMAWN